MKPTLFALFIIVTTFACNSPETQKQTSSPDAIPSYEKLDSAAWLLGTWTDSSKMGRSTETWHKENDSTYTAESFIVSQKDTVFYEQVKLQQRNKEVYYVAKTKGQNDDESVPFTLTSKGAETLIFENPQHDFPSKITYTKVSDDSLYAEISGMAKGQERKVGFPFKKTGLGK